MISCEARHEARARTLPQLEAAGITTRVHLSPCDPAGPRENARIAATALADARKQARAHDLPGALFCEDDIDLAPAFPTLHALAVRANAVTYFYTHEALASRLWNAYGRDLYHAIRAGERLTPGLYPIQKRATLYHNQLVYLPASTLRALDLTDLQHNTLRNGQPNAADVWLSRWLQAHESTPVLVALPNPAQHRCDRTARTTDGSTPCRFKTSRTYHQWRHP